VLEAMSAGLPLISLSTLHLAKVKRFSNAIQMKSLLDKCPYIEKVSNKERESYIQVKTH
jgi:hypothetical protein